jgi:hypothetical protein
MKTPAKWLVQTSMCHGFVSRGWGYGRVMSWGPWATVHMADTEAEGREKLEAIKANGGLRRARLVYKRQVVAKTEG